MRAFTACLTVLLGLGAFSLVACSSDATTTASGGGAGEAATDNGGGGASSGGATVGEAGACLRIRLRCMHVLHWNQMYDARRGLPRGQHFRPGAHSARGLRVRPLQDTRRVRDRIRAFKPAWSLPLAIWSRASTPIARPIVSELGECLCAPAIVGAQSGSLSSLRAFVRAEGTRSRRVAAGCWCLFGRAVVRRAAGVRIDARRCW